MYAGAVFIQLALKWNIYLAVVLLLSVTALYTVAGDLSSLAMFKPVALLLEKLQESPCSFINLIMCCRGSGCSYLHRRCSDCHHAGRSTHPHGLQSVKAWTQPLCTSSGGFMFHYSSLSPLSRLCRGWRLERSDAGIRRRHPHSPRAQLHMRHPSRGRLPHLQRPGDLWPSLAWRHHRHVSPLHVVLVLWSGTFRIFSIRWYFNLFCTWHRALSL